MSNSEKVSFWENLKERRFFQILISYLVGAWALIQFVDWIVNRYDYSPDLTDKFLTLMLLLVPSVCILAYNHGKPGPDVWTKFEKLFVPINLILAILLASFLFPSNSSAETSTVVVQNEKGETITRVVPKASLTNRLVMFPFQVTGDESKSWTGLGFPILQGVDMEQDNRLYAITTFGLEWSYSYLGLNLQDKLSFANYKKIATNYYSDYFTTGTMNFHGDSLTVNYNIYTSKDGKLFGEYSITKLESDIFEIVDQLTVAVREQIYTESSSKNLENYIDLPAAELFSSDLEALKMIQFGMAANQMENDLDKAIQYLEKAIEIDPKFAGAYLELADSKLEANNNLEEVMPLLDKALDLSNGLSERQKFDFKYQYYRMSNDMVSASKLLEMWRQFYPQDYMPYSRLIGIYKNELVDIGAAVKVAKEAIDNGHEGSVYLTLAHMLSEQNKPEEALKYYQTFNDRYPERATEVSDLGWIYIRLGDMKKAKEHFEKLAVLKPNDPYIIGNLGVIQKIEGKFDKSIQTYQKALSKCKRSRDSANVYSWIEYTYQDLGQIAKATEYMNKCVDVRTNFTSIVNAKMKLLYPASVSKYKYTNRREEAHSFIVNFIDTYLSKDPVGKTFTLLRYAAVMEDGELMDSIYRTYGDVLIKSGGNSIAMLGEGLMLKANGKYEEATRKIEEFRDSTEMTEEYFLYQLAQCYRLTGKYEDAIKTIKQAADTYASSELLLEKAKCYDGLKQKEKAMELYNQLRKRWTNADADFTLKKELEKYLETY